jgi:hypothetical protein
MENAGPDCVTVIAPEALPPVFLSVNVREIFVPEPIGPAVHDGGLKLSDGGALLAAPPA